MSKYLNVIVKLRNVNESNFNKYPLITVDYTSSKLTPLNKATLVILKYKRDIFNQNNEYSSIYYR